MLRACVLVLFMLTIGFGQDSIVVAKIEYDNLKSEIRLLKKQYKALKKEYRKTVSVKHIRKIEQERKVFLSKHVRIYYVVCKSKLKNLNKKFPELKAKERWDLSRSSLDNMCRVIEVYLKKDELVKVKKAKKRGLIREFGVYGKSSMKRILKYLNDPKNGFTQTESTPPAPAR